MPSAQVLAAIGVGSNLGDRVSHINFGFTQLSQLPQTNLVATSRLVPTAPVAGDDPGAEAGCSQAGLGGEYLNAAALIMTRLEPRGVLDHLLRIERERGRVRDPGNRWGARTLDLDLLLYGDRRIDELGLHVPHPRMHARRFVLEPLAEIAPGLMVPGQGRTVTQLLRSLADG